MYLYVCPAVGFTCADTMADLNIPANDVPAEQAPAIAPPTRTDDKILPLRKLVPVGKSNYVLDVLKLQRNPIFKEEFVQSVQTFLTEKKRLTMASRGKKKSTPLLIPSIKFTKLIIHHLKTKHNIHPRTGSPLHYLHEDNILGTLMSVGKDGREVFGMPIPDALLTDAIKRAPYYDRYLAHVAEYQQYLDEERGMAEEEAVPESPKSTKVTKPKATMQTNPSTPKATKVTKPAGDKAPKPTSSQQPKPTPTPTKSSKEVQGKVTKKCKSKSPLKLVDEFVDEGVPDKEPAYNDEEANLQRALKLSLKEQEERTQGPARPMVFREPDSGRFQPLPEVQGKGKEKAIEEQAACDLLTLQTPKKKSPADQFIFQRRTPMITEPSGNAESPSLDAELTIADIKTKFDEPDISVAKDTKMEVTHTVTPITTTGVWDEGQGGSDLGKAEEVMKIAEAEQTTEE
ncbi:retrovirus-related pol polyprotein from transposon TNT 1-94 [Tanacetum coccineum]|uniref:Retrovirus-related pol polyprotein from transposon TNT 1-94 n=1 Tax=Tanacetum coccineum TaxID=301880 RepID=A0ABQ5HSY7_9ASTR